MAKTAAMKDMGRKTMVTMVNITIVFSFRNSGQRKKRKEREVAPSQRTLSCLQHGLRPGETRFEGVCVLLLQVEEIGQLGEV
jgi:hypothetical protein